MSQFKQKWSRRLLSVVVSFAVFTSVADSKADELALGDRLAAELSVLKWDASHLDWSRSRSDNFVVFAQGVDPSTVAALTAKLESCLALLRAAWRHAATPSQWSPQCVVVIHRTPESYDQAVGESGWDSWGSARVSRSRGKITDRRIDLCAPTLRRLIENLPHELTHVVLADEFAHDPAPRWLDEGAAVLAESCGQVKRRNDAAHELAGTNLIFRSAELLQSSTYPEGATREHFYAESHQLTQLLLAQGDAAQLVSFAKSARRMGYEAALRESYKVNGLAHLDALRNAEKKTAGLSSQASRERGTIARAVVFKSSQGKGQLINPSYREATALPPTRGN